MGTEDGSGRKHISKRQKQSKCIVHVHDFREKGEGDGDSVVCEAKTNAMKSE